MSTPQELIEQPLKPLSDSSSKLVSNIVYQESLQQKLQWVQQQLALITYKPGIDFENIIFSNANEIRRYIYQSEYCNGAMILFQTKSLLEQAIKSYDIYINKRDEDTKLITIIGGLQEEIEESLAEYNNFLDNPFAQQYRRGTDFRASLSLTDLEVTEKFYITLKQQEIDEHSRYTRLLTYLYGTYDSELVALSRDAHRDTLSEKTHEEENIDLLKIQLEQLKEHSIFQKLSEPDSCSTYYSPDILDFEIINHNKSDIERKLHDLEYGLKKNLNKSRSIASLRQEKINKKKQLRIATRLLNIVENVGWTSALYPMFVELNMQQDYVKIWGDPKHLSTANPNSNIINGSRRKKIEDFPEESSDIAIPKVKATKDQFYSLGQKLQRKIDECYNYFHIWHKAGFESRDRELKQELAIDSRLRDMYSDLLVQYDAVLELLTVKKSVSVSAGASDSDSDSDSDCKKSEDREYQVDKIDGLRCASDTSSGFIEFRGCYLDETKKTEFVLRQKIISRMEHAIKNYRDNPRGKEFNKQGDLVWGFSLVRLNLSFEMIDPRSIKTHLAASDFEQNDFITYQLDSLSLSAVPVSVTSLSTKDSFNSRISIPSAPSVVPFVSTAPFPELILDSSRETDKFHSQDVMHHTSLLTPVYNLKTNSREDKELEKHVPDQHQTKKISWFHKVTTRLFQSGKIKSRQSLPIGRTASIFR